MSLKVKVCDGRYLVSVKGKFSVFGNSYDTKTLNDDQAKWLIAQGWDGIKEAPKVPETTKASNKKEEKDS